MLRSAHASHIPGPGPFSVWVHRENAATVSSTEISCEADELVMTYQPGNPCEADGDLAVTRIPVFDTCGEKFA